MPVILATQEAKIRRITVQSQPRQIVHKTLHRKTLHKRRKRGMMEWLQMKALNSSPSTTKRKKRKSTGKKRKVAE
jgi:hypothetical protein